LEKDSKEGKMTQFEKLQKIIEHAKKKGFDLYKNFGVYTCNFCKHRNAFVREYPYESDYLSYKIKHIIPPSQIFLSHSFLKAFFGEQLCEIYPNMVYNCNPKTIDCDIGQISWDIPLWQYYTQKLSITPEEKRIDYLYNFIKEK
jgi:hypothetical protein